MNSDTIARDFENCFKKRACLNVRMMICDASHRGTAGQPKQKGSKWTLEGRNLLAGWLAGWLTGWRWLALAGWRSLARVAGASWQAGRGWLAGWRWPALAGAGGPKV